MKGKQFIKACELILSLHKALLTARSNKFNFQMLKLRVLNGKSVAFYAEKSHQIFCLRKILENQGSIPVSDLTETDKRNWGPLENCITAYLNLSLGLGNQCRICKHPAWHLTRVKHCIPNTIRALQTDLNSAEELNGITLFQLILLFIDLYSLRESLEEGSAELLFKQKAIDSLCYLHFQQSSYKFLKSFGSINHESVRQLFA